MNNGEFSGNPRTEWLSSQTDERAMRLLEPFWFIDAQGRRWEAPAGTEINGASIPRTLWSAIGSPYTGVYRRAAVVHDAVLDDPRVPRDEADKMFYYACLAGGCSTGQAKLLYAGVRIGTWMTRTRPQESVLVERMPDASRLPGEASALELEVRALYTLIAADLCAAGADFKQVRSVVDRRLAEQPLR